MIEVTPKQTTVAVTVDGHDGTVVTVQPTRQPVIVTPVFTVATGPAGAGAEVGPGFKIVGSEIRYDISSLTRG